MAEIPKYRIIEIRHNGRVWYEVQRCKREHDIRGESWDTWQTVSGNHHDTLDAARAYRDERIASVRIERVIE